MSSGVDFDAPDLAARIEQLTQYQLDRLSFGVILIDRDGIVQFYSETELRESGYGALPLGQNLFEFGWVGDFADPDRDLRIRVQSARAGGYWICVERDQRKTGAR